MTSFVGSQTTFISALESLIELEYDAVEAYVASINRLKDQDFKDKFTEFKSDHERHIKVLTKLLEIHDCKAPTSPDNTKYWLAKGRVILGGLMGDKSILRAMTSNELDINSAYERMCLHDDIWNDAAEIMRSFLGDERRHTAWLEVNTKMM